VKNGFFAAILFAAGLAAGSPAVATVLVNGELATSDFAAVDATGHFYYDLYQVASVASVDRTVTASLTPYGNYQPYLAFTRDLGLLPAPVWGDVPDIYVGFERVASGESGTQSFSFLLGAGENVLVVVSNYNYVENPGFELGAYDLTLSTAAYIPPDPCSDCPDGPGPQAIVEVGTDDFLVVNQILPAAVPAPFTPALLLIGLAGLGLTRRRAAA